MNSGIGGWVARRALLSGERTAFVCGGRSFTYSDVEERTNRVAHSLRRLGVRAGDRVAIVLANSVEFMELLFACGKLGALCTPINTRLSVPEIGHVLADSGADVVAYHQEFAETVRCAVERSDVRVRHAVRVGGTPLITEFDYDELVGDGDPNPAAVDVAGSDVACLMYTSGTTGRPKGAMLTHDNLLWNAINALTSGRGLGQRDRTVTVAPLFHIAGLGVHTLPLVYVGGTNVLLPSFDPVETLTVMARERVTVQFMVPAMWSALLRVPDFAEYDLSHLEQAVSGGSPASPSLIDSFRHHALPFQEGFGMTETAPAVSMLDTADLARKAGSVGQPAWHVEVRVVDATDRPVPDNTVGELVVRGPNVFAGYWMRPRETAASLRAGWFHTGDVGYLDTDGFVHLVDRKTDVLISGGENVYPVEVERVLHEHPGVVEAAVIGVADAKWGEVPLAAVVVDVAGAPDRGELEDWCRQRLAGFKVPKHVVYLTALPRNTTGKVLKSELRARHTEECGVRGDGAEDAADADGAIRRTV